MEYCVQFLIDSAQSDLDIVLANSVKLRAFTEALTRTAAESADPHSGKAPIWMHIPSAKLTLQGIAAGVPLRVRNNSAYSPHHKSWIILY